MDGSGEGGLLSGLGAHGELSDYEKVRASIISDRKAELAKLGFYESLGQAKRDVLQPGTSAKLDHVRKPPRGKLRDVSNQESLPPPRKSTRERKPVLYTFTADEDVDAFSPPRKKRTRKEALDEESYNPEKDESTIPCSSPPKKHRKSARKKQTVDYNEDTDDLIPATDSYIWCSVCNDQKYNGCELHPPRFATLEEFNLKVEKSAVAKNAGDGVFNRGDVIQEGTVFGPYVGKVHNKASYNKMIEAGEESGNAWAIRDSDGIKIIAYIDPGKSINPTTHWLTKINCATKSYAQNMVGFQLHGQIYYRVTQDIHNGAELLVYYGQEYAKELGINVAKIDYFRGKEDHKEEGWKCPGCNTVFASEQAMYVHQDTSGLSCCNKLAKYDRHLVCKGCQEVFTNGKILKDHQTGICFPNCFNKEAAEDRKKCAVCKKVFSSAQYMKIHMRTIHAKIKDWKCPTCGKLFSTKENLGQHIKAVHQMSRPHKCPDCDQSFALAHHMRNHQDSAHRGIRYPCTYHPPPGDFEYFTFSCNKIFTEKGSLKDHVRQCHTRQHKYECKICLDKDVWWGCMTPWKFERHKKSRHPQEYAVEQEAFLAKHPFVCKYSKCRKRFETGLEMNRHQEKLH